MIALCCALIVLAFALFLLDEALAGRCPTCGSSSICDDDCSSGRGGFS